MKPSERLELWAMSVGVVLLLLAAAVEIFT
jgi:hypothetical protein